MGLFKYKFSDEEWAVFKKAIKIVLKKELRHFKQGGFFKMTALEGHFVRFESAFATRYPASFAMVRKENSCPPAENESISSHFKKRCSEYSYLVRIYNDAQLDECELKQLYKDSDTVEGSKIMWREALCIRGSVVRRTLFYFPEKWLSDLNDKEKEEKDACLDELSWVYENLEF